MAWGGEHIDQVPLSSKEPQSGRPWLEYSTEEVVETVKDFLLEHDVSLRGLSIRIHSRDPVTEYVILSAAILMLMSLVELYGFHAQL